MKICQAKEKKKEKKDIKKKEEKREGRERLTLKKGSSLGSVCGCELSSSSAMKSVASSTVPSVLLSFRFTVRVPSFQ